MLKAFLAVASFLVVSTAAVSAFAAETHGDKERKEDITRHRAMAKAHTDAAICLESGKKEADCDKALQAACKGLAIGKSCGMKHAH
jgi:predicted transcriptional regulator